MNARLPVGACLLLAILGGCAEPAAPARVPEEAVEDPDGLTATLVRVVPRGHAIEWTAYQMESPCPPDGTDACRSPVLQLGPATVGTTRDDPEWSVSDPEALFWRLDAEVRWHSENPAVSEAQLEVFTRRPCGPGCWKERLVDERIGPSPLVIERRDVYLQEGETGLLLRLTTPAGTVPAPGAGVHFEVLGNADGYIPAGDAPVVMAG